MIFPALDPPSRKLRSRRHALGAEHVVAARVQLNAAGPRVADDAVVLPALVAGVGRRRHLPGRLERPTSNSARFLFLFRPKFEASYAFSATRRPACYLTRLSIDNRGSNFARLVLVCIDSYDNEQRRILQHFSRSNEIYNICIFLATLIFKILRIFEKLFHKIRKFSGEELLSVDYIWTVS